MSIRIPTTAKFKEALSACAPGLPEGYVRLLLAHYDAPNRTITASQAANAVGYKNFNAANLHYGRLAQRLADYLRLDLADTVKVLLMAEFVSPSTRGNPQWLWVMRPELAEALEDLGWVSAKPPASLSRPSVASMKNAPKVAARTRVRLIAWNCQLGYHRKVQHLWSLKPDIAVIPECARPAPVSRCPTLWAGPKPAHGLLVTSAEQWSLTEAPNVNFATDVYVAAEVTGPVDFQLLGIWAKPIHQKKGYVASIRAAIDSARAFLSEGPSVVLGDFNSHPTFGPDHHAMVDELSELGLVSAYHSFHGIDPGDESHPTHYHYRKEDSPFHIDYCFVPESWARKIVNVEVGEYVDWAAYSDHCPLIVDLEP